MDKQEKQPAAAGVAEPRSRGAEFVEWLRSGAGVLAVDEAWLAKVIAGGAVPVVRSSGANTTDERVAAEALLAADGPSLIYAGSSAIVPVRGFLTGRPTYSFWGDRCGWSCQEIQAMVRMADADPAVKSIVLDCDSPGGLVEGVPETWAAIRAVSKSVIAVVNHLCASGAYWIACAAGEIVISPSGSAGSIGVFTLHSDLSQALEEFGEKVTLIKAGRYKAENLPYFPLSDDARDHMQERVNETYGDFVTAVAAGRRTTPDKVTAGYGEGRCLGAAACVSARLADRIGTLAEVLAEQQQMDTMPTSRSRRAEMVAEESEQDSAPGQEPGQGAESVGQEPQQADSVETLRLRLRKFLVEV